MFRSFYLKLSLSNIKRNKELLFPYILTWFVTIIMYYILGAITFSPELSNVGGGDDMRIILNFGLVIIAIFAIVFLFYTNSFIVKRRKKELSLYNILGLDKKQIACIMFYEGIIITFVTLVVGILSGYLLSKLVFVILVKLLDSNAIFSFAFSSIAALMTLILFTMIFVLILIYNILQIVINNPIALLKEGVAGEKEPKTKIWLTIIGVVTLSSGYLLAQLITDPILAMGIFFIAVILVMIGTYALFTSGSISILKILKANKRFYYQSKHFSVISGMLYRMKQNAVGLANICILSTMVLVTISTTLSLYIATEQTISNQYPYDAILSTHFQTDEYNDQLLKQVYQLADDQNIELEGFIAFDHQDFWAIKQDNNFFSNDEVPDFDQYCVLTFITIDQYNVIHNTDKELKSDEVLLYTTAESFNYDHFNYTDKTFMIKEILADTELKTISKAMISNVEEYVIVVNDENIINDIYKTINGNVDSSTLSYLIAFNIVGDDSNVKMFNKALYDVGDDRTLLESKDNVRSSFYGLYGGLLFIGCFLGLLFLLATALIIYYKQVSEGYDDAQRFKILKNVGMSNDEIQKSINFQIRLVFFVPLAFAIIHIGFAFKIITKMLALFGLVNIVPFIMCTLSTIMIFAIIYMIIYRLTAKTYYRIVG